MKKINQLLWLILLVTFLLPACKSKDKHQTTLEKIQGKWTFESEIENDHSSGQDNITNTTGGPNDILDFRTDGKVYSDVMGTKDTSTYTVSGDTKIVLDGTETFDIKTLSANSFIIYHKESFGTEDYDEVTLALKR